MRNARSHKRINPNTHGAPYPLAAVADVGHRTFIEISYSILFMRGPNVYIRATPACL